MGDTNAEFLGEQIKGKVGPAVIGLNIDQHPENKIAFFPVAPFAPDLLHINGQYLNQIVLHTLQAVMLIQGFPHVLGKTDFVGIYACLIQDHGRFHQALHIQLTDHFR
ncbi:hypothetical protein D3C81_1896620 [compost metagenome]